MFGPHGVIELPYPNRAERDAQIANEMASTRSEFPWRVRLAASDVPDAGRQFDLVADGPVRAATAKLAGLRDLPRLEASFDVMLQGNGGLRVTGRVRATVGQACVVTLDPIENEVDEPIELVFAPLDGPPAGIAGDDGEEVAEDGPEPLVDGTIDLGAIATEFLLLAIDPYPRKPEAVFQSPMSGETAAHPFAALAVLKKGRDGETG
jgi:uncharacterized metal-binding protein YceD (DUF177 family)